MSVDYFPCGICENTICDAGFYEACANCSIYVCEECYPDQKKKYKTVKNDEKKSGHYGKNALNECDCCSEKTKPERIKKLEDELKRLKS